jgi:hypothetical protein
VITLIRAELRKISGTAAAIIMLVAPIAGAALALPLATRYDGAIWYDYTYTTLSISNALLIPCLIGIVAAFVFGREALDGTHATLRHSRFSAVEVVTAKCVAVALLGAGMTAVSAAATSLVGLVIRLSGFYWPLIYRYLVVGTIAGAVACCTIPLVGAIALLTKGYFVASIVATMGTLLGFFFSGTAWFALNPWSLPVYYVSGFLRLISRDPYKLVPEVLPAATAFTVVGFVAAAYVQSRTDITLER